jgi:hypothetical protein
MPCTYTVQARSNKPSTEQPAAKMTAIGARTAFDAPKVITSEFWQLSEKP